MANDTRALRGAEMVQVFELRLDEIIIPDWYNTTIDRSERRALKESFVIHGQINPIRVIRVDGRWQLWDGWKRIAVARTLRIKKIKAIDECTLKPAPGSHYAP